MDHTTLTSRSELWLFGSSARGDTDAASDVDVLVVGDPEEGMLERLGYPPDQMSVVRYDWAELRHMASYGSLFLHHVRLEGRPLVAPEFSQVAALLDRLPPYHRAQRELSSFGVVLKDVEAALHDDHSPAFELSVVATALRHSCILGCYAIGEPTFGRRSAFTVFLRHIQREELLEPAQKVYDFRLYEDGRGDPPFCATTNDVRLWLCHARDVVTEVEKALSAYD